MSAVLGTGAARNTYGDLRRRLAWSARLEDTCPHWLASACQALRRGRRALVTPTVPLHDRANTKSERHSNGAAVGTGTAHRLRRAPGSRRRSQRVERLESRPRPRAHAAAGAAARCGGARSWAAAHTVGVAMRWRARHEPQLGVCVKSGIHTGTLGRGACRRTAGGRLGRRCRRHPRATS